MRPLVLVLLLCILIPAPPGLSAKDNSPARIVVQKINTYRAGAGLGKVILDPKLSVGCKNHARYLILNNVNPHKDFAPHDEKPGLKGYTKAGKKCARNSSLMDMLDAELSVDYMIATFFHRIPFLDPALTRVGFGYEEGGRWKRATVIDIFSNVYHRRKRKPVYVAYPGPNQQNIPPAFGLQHKGLVLREHPNPIPRDRDGKAGFPVTLSFFNYQRVKGVRAKLYQAGRSRSLSIWLSTPEKPVYDKIQQMNTVAIFAKDELKANTWYRVEVDAQVNGKSFRLHWKFKTGSPPGD